MNETLKATISAGCIVLCNILMVCCGLFIDANTLTTLICALVTLGVTVYGCWKNHNFTNAAQMGQAVTDALKAGEEIYVVTKDQLGEEDAND